MDDAHMIYEKKEGIAQITINRPDRRNAMTYPMLQTFERMLDDVTADDAVKVLVITGKGTAFCSGQDVKAAPDEDNTKKVSSKLGAIAIDSQTFFPVVMRSMPKPSIAAVNGHALGLGFAISLACDMRIASNNAKFGAYWILRGIPPESAGAFTLPRIVGRAKACELCFTGRLVDALEAKEIGLVNHVVPAEELMPRTLDLAKTIAAGPPIAMGVTKWLIDHGLESNDMHTFMEREIFAMSYCFQTEDRQEGIKAFIEKRAPRFQGK